MKDKCGQCGTTMNNQIDVLLSAESLLKTLLDKRLSRGVPVDPTKYAYLPIVNDVYPEVTLRRLTSGGFVASIETSGAVKHATAESVVEALQILLGKVDISEKIEITE